MKYFLKPILYLDFESNYYLYLESIFFFLSYFKLNYLRFQQQSQYFVTWPINTIWSISFPNSEILISTNHLQMFSIQKVTLCFTIPVQFWLLKSFFPFCKMNFPTCTAKSAFVSQKYLYLRQSLCGFLLSHLYFVYLNLFPFYWGSNSWSVYCVSGWSWWQWSLCLSSVGRKDCSECLSQVRHWQFTNNG